MKPLKHQKKFVRGYDGPLLLAHEGGTGKTVCGCLWLRDRRDNDALVVCPAKVHRKWLQALKAWGTKATVMTYSQFKEAEYKEWSAIVVDEIDECASPVFQAKKRSKISEKLYGLVKQYPHVELLGLSATPVRSTPWNLHTILCLIGIFIPVKVWREKYFYLQTPDAGRFSFLQRPAFLVRSNWRALIRKDLEKYADIVLLRECVKELPPVTETTIEVKTPRYVMKPDDKIFYSEHRWEQQNKIKEVLAAGRKFRKVMVVAFYKEQILELKRKLSNDKDTFAIYGGVKDQEAEIERATESEDCYFIVQSGIGAGFDGDTFSSLIFVSTGFSVRDFVQMKFRVRRIHNLNPVDIRYLVGGRCDEAVLSNLKKGKEFVPSEWK